MTMAKPLTLLDSGHANFLGHVPKNASGMTLAELFSSLLSESERQSCHSPGVMVDIGLF